MITLNKRFKRKEVTILNYIAKSNLSSYGTKSLRLLPQMNENSSTIPTNKNPVANSNSEELASGKNNVVNYRPINERDIY